jgi:hypothetical protein
MLTFPEGMPSAFAPLSRFAKAGHGQHDDGKYDRCSQAESPPTAGSRVVIPFCRKLSDGFFETPLRSQKTRQCLKGKSLEGFSNGQPIHTENDTCTIVMILRKSVSEVPRMSLKLIHFFFRVSTDRPHNGRRSVFWTLPGSMESFEAMLKENRG